jgi:hypothetical protein
MTAPLSPDTSRDAADRQVEAWRALGPAGRLALAVQLSAAVLELEREGWRRRHPEMSENEIAAAMVERRLGTALARAAYSNAPNGR